MRPSALSVADLEGRLSAEFPGSFNRESGLAILEAWHGGCRVRLGYSSNTLRPGGTISGVTMMMLADLTMYVAVLASIGWKPARGHDQPQHKLPAQSTARSADRAVPAD